MHSLLLLLAVISAGIALGGGLRGDGEGAAPAVASETTTLDTAGYLRPPIVLATLPGIRVRQQAQAEPTAAPAPTPEPTPQPTPEPTPEPTPQPTPEPIPAYYTYTIQPGDTVASIAEAYGIGQQYILWNNAEMGDDPDFVIAGQEILIPSVDGIIYSVRLDDTLADIAAFYEIEVETIVAFAPNGLASADSIIEGTRLVLPGARPPPPPPAPKPPPPTPAAALATTEPEQPAPASIYIWPFQGPITSYFGEPRGKGIYHQGIDIEGIGQEGAPILAAAAGQVVLTESHPAYGNYVIIRHPDGSETMYAHLSKIRVGYGQFVDQGEVVGGMGHTGYTIGIDGNHLHFELWIDGVPVDPLPYLP